MTVLKRYRVAMWGGQIGSGVMTFYGLETADLQGPIDALLASVKTKMPNAVHMQIEAGGDLFNDTDGELTGAWVGTTNTDHVGGEAGAYAAPAGVVLTWLTDAVLDGRRLKGRNYIVPLAASSYQADGTIADDNMTYFRTAAAVYSSAVADEGVVWHRPRKAVAADGSRPAITARDGGHALITGTSVKDKVAVLTSRRS